MLIPSEAPLPRLSHMPPSPPFSRAVVQASCQPLMAVRAAGMGAGQLVILLPRLYPGGRLDLCSERISTLLVRGGVKVVSASGGRGEVSAQGARLDLYRVYTEHLASGEWGEGRCLQCVCVLRRIHDTLLLSPSDMYGAHSPQTFSRSLL